MQNRTRQETIHTDLAQSHQLATRINNAALSSRSADREMHIQREEIVHTMWEEYFEE